MVRLAHPQAMQPSAPGRTRTAPAQMPEKYPLGGRYLSYILFGASAFFFLAMGLLVLRLTWALGSGQEAWQALLEDFANPIYIAFHAVACVVFLWCAQRFLFKLTPKANPPKIGPLRRPPLVVFPLLLGLVWLGATAVVLIVVWGIFP